VLTNVICIENKVKIDIVIPTYLNDFNCILPCINNLLLLNILLHNIIISISKINYMHKNFLKDKIDALDFKNIFIHNTSYKQNVSQNRNRVIKYCQTYTKP